ncbi:MAG TPA: hypothetical protein VF516_11150, partial [Kofleriaceae bacterium]
MRPGVVLVLALAAVGGVPVVGGVPGCGGRTTTAPPEKKDGGPSGAPGPSDASVEVDAVALGLPDLGAYGWRKRGGQPAFRVAVQAEARGD